MLRPVLALVLGLAIASACAPSPPSREAPAAPAAGAPAGALDDAAYRQQVVAAARTEGEVNATIQNAWSPAGLRQFEDVIEREYGVRIKINHTPVDNYPQRLATQMSELAANTVPSFDLYQTSDSTALKMLDADAAETTRWEPLLMAGTPDGVAQGDGRLIVVYTAHIGLMYDPQVESDAEAPRSLKDFADPKWRNRIMTFSYPTSYVPYVVRFGREETLGALRAAMANGVVPDIFAGQYTRFAAKEYPMVMITSGHHQTARVQGINAKFAAVDLAVNSQHFVALPKKAAHANAARLVAAVLAGPEGQRIAEEQLGLGNSFYASSSEAKVAEDARLAGFPRFTWAESPEAVALLRSPEGLELERQIQTILSGG